jgi:hypothetical protein
MSSKVMITTPYPTRSEIIAHLGISEAHAVEIERWFEELRAERAKQAEKSKQRRSTTPARAARKRPASRAKKK